MCVWERGRARRYEKRGFVEYTTEMRKWYDDDDDETGANNWFGEEVSKLRKMEGHWFLFYLFERGGGKA